jgi:hypothetical protein
MRSFTRSFTRSFRRSFRRPLVLALALSLGVTAAPAVVLAGPPWISVELPANPFDRASRGAFLLVHAFHHGTELGLPMTGRAEGIVNGQRRTVPLKFEATSRQGVYALQNQWGTEGTWTLVLTASQGPNDGATALVELSPDGRVAVTVPTQRGREGSFPRAVTDDEIVTALRARASAMVGARAR